MQRSDNLHLSKKLHAIRMVDSGITYQAVANQFDVLLDSIRKILDTRNRYEHVKKTNAKRTNLNLVEKIKVLHKVEQNNCNFTTVAKLCGIHRKTVGNIWKNREALLNKEKRNACATVKRPLKAQYPLIEAKVLDFVVYARSQRYPVTSSQIKEYALRAAEQGNETRFRASNGWLQRFLRRSSIQRSLKLHGKGGTALPASTEDRMVVIRDITSTYEAQNIYNMDESGLLYRMGPSRA